MAKGEIYNALQFCLKTNAGCRRNKAKLIIVIIARRRAEVAKMAAVGVPPLIVFTFVFTNVTFYVFDAQLRHTYVQALIDDPETGQTHSPGRK